MAPQKMLYIKDEDVGLISKAQECSKENFSNTVIKALKFYVDSQEDADFDLQKLIIGFDPIVFDRDDFTTYLGVSPKSQNTDQNMEEGVYEMWDGLYNLVLDYLQVSFFQTPITFFGKELVAREQKQAAVFNLRAIKASKDLLVKAVEKNFADPCPYDLVSMKFLEDGEEPSNDSDSPWYGDISASFKVFRTRGNKFLIWASTNSGDLNWSSLGLNSIVPCASDYVVFDELRDDLKKIKTENYGIEFELPEGLVQDAKQALRTQKPVKHLSI
jgi:hypothetical protein